LSQAQANIGLRVWSVRGLDGAKAMSGREALADANLLLALASIVVRALGIGVAITLVIVWVCS